MTAAESLNTSANMTVAEYVDYVFSFDSWQLRFLRVRHPKITRLNIETMLQPEFTTPSLVEPTDFLKETYKRGILYTVGYSSANHHQHIAFTREWREIIKVYEL